MTASVKSITSLTNERVKAIRALEQRKTRRETGLFVAEGASILLTARAAGFPIETLVYRSGALQTDLLRGLVAGAARAGAEILEVSAAVLEKLAAKENPQSMLGVFRQRWSELPPPRSIPKSAVWLALEEVRDPGNLGTIIRTADAVGVEGLVLVGTCCDPYAREAVRATMGSIFNVPVAAASRQDFLAWLTNWPGEIVGTHLEATTDFRAQVYREPIMVVMGSEGPGLSAELARACTQKVKIPMRPTLDSLNLAVATGLMLYEVCRSRLTI